MNYDELEAKGLLNDQYSVGTSVLSANLLILLSQTKLLYDTVMLNIDIILRNTYDKDMKFKDWVDKAIKELNTFLDEITMVMSNNSIIKNPAIVMYMANYDKIIPTEYRKKLTPKRLEFKQAHDLIVKRIGKHIKREIRNNVLVLYTHVSSNIAVSQHLKNFLISVKNLHRIVLMTHWPVDYHFLNIKPHVEMLEAYTGNILTKKMLSLKVFKDNEIPFCPALHNILGDEKQIQCLLKNTEKKQLIEQIKKEKWRLKTNREIERILSLKGYKFPIKL